MKKCSLCQKPKPESSFYKNKKTKDGLQSWCVDCYKNKYIQKRRDKEYIKKDRYRQLCGRVRRKQRGAAGKPVLTIEEWEQFCIKTDADLDRLLTIWKKSGYKRELAISVDRIDNNRGYEQDNLQWLSTLDNTMKYAIQDKGFSEVIVIDDDGTEYTFPNQVKAARFLGVHKKTVRRARKSGSKILHRYTIL